MAKGKHIAVLFGALLCLGQAAPENPGRLTRIYSNLGLYEINLGSGATQAGARHAIRRDGKLIGHLVVVRLRGGQAVCKLDKTTSTGEPKVGDLIGKALPSKAAPPKSSPPSKPKPPPVSTHPKAKPQPKPNPKSTPASPKPKVNGPELFALTVEPLLSARCYECHGPGKQKGKLNLLEQFGAGPIRGILQVVNLDTPGDSVLIDRLTDPDDPMPPEGPMLKPAEVSAIRQWIAAGAPPPPAVLTVPKGQPGPNYTGTVHQFYPGGPRRSLVQFNKGARNGRVMEWYANGFKKNEFNYLNGQLHGLGRYWYENGVLQYQANYSQGRLNGRFADWWPNGQISSEEFYQMGQKSGRWRAWWPNGKPSEEKIWRNGVLSGVVKWDKDGGVRLPDLGPVNNDLALLTPKPASFAQNVPWTVSGPRNAIDKIYPGKPVSLIRAVFGAPDASTPEAWTYRKLKITNPKTNREFTRVRFEFKNGAVSRVIVFNNQNERRR